jgi:hypothetical protein
MRQWPGLGGPGPLRAAAFGIFYLYVWLRIKPHLIYHVQEPVFFRGGAFFDSYLSVPGGVAQYLAAFAGQSYAFGALGALVLTAVIAAIGLCLRGLVQAATGHRHELAAAAPMVLLLALHNRYAWDLAFDLSLLACVAAAWLVLRTGRQRRPLLFVLLAPLVYWVAGGAFLLFVGICAVGEALDRRPAVAAGLALAGAALPWVAARTVYPGLLHDAYLRLLPLDGPYLLGEPRMLAVAAILYLSAPLLMVAAHLGVPRPAPAATTGVLAVIGAFLVYGTLDTNHRTLLEIDERARDRDWQGVLTRVPQLTAYDPLTVYNVQQALCHTGRLSSELFSHPHLENAPIFVASPEAPSRFLVVADILLDMGYVNKAEHMLQEAVEIQGDRPSILRRLVLVNLLKDRPAAARVYLGQLQQTLLHDDWATAQLAALQADPRRDDDDRIRRIRGRMVDVDYPGYFSTEDMLRQVLEHDPTNLLAFDLLMGHYLQTAQLDKVVAGIAALDRFPESFPPPAIPRLYEEAAMLWATQVRLRTGTLPRLPLQGRQLSQRTQERYTAFSRILTENRSDREGARLAHAESHSDTFWYYYLYRSPDTGIPVVSRATRQVP